MKPAAYGGLIGIVGPTASGKTGLSLKLAQALGANILCVDSRTIYRGMDIGTAKPTDKERRLVRHLGLDLVDPDERFSVYDFVNYARPILRNYVDTKQPLILVGGSGLYFDALLFDYTFRQETGDRSMLNGLSHTQLVQRAQAAYSDLIEGIDVKNKRRLENLILRGPTNHTDRESLKYPIKLIGVLPEKLQIKQNISIRTSTMLSNGFIHEVERLKNTYGEDCVALNSTGYAAVMRYLDEKLSKAELEAQINSDTYKLARKQRTWFKRNPHIQWFSHPQLAFASVIADDLPPTKVQ